MARTSTSKTNPVETVENVDVVEESMAAADVETDKNMDEVVENDTEVKEVKQEEAKPTKKSKAEKVEPLKDDDEIEVVSLIPKVTYKDNYTSDFYEWDEVGHVEYMTYKTLKDMRRQYRGYFDNLWLKPNDERAIKGLGLERVYKKYEFLMDGSNYTRDNIDEISNNISSTPNLLKISIVNKIKSLVVNGDISDVKVIVALDKLLDTDLVSLLD